MLLSDKEIADLYLHENRSCANIAILAHCSETTIYNKLKRNGIALRNKSDANKKVSDLIIIVLYNLGLSVSQVGKVLNIDPSTVVKRLHNIRFPLRSRRNSLLIRYNDSEFNKLIGESDILHVVRGTI